MRLRPAFLLIFLALCAPALTRGAPPSPEIRPDDWVLRDVQIVDVARGTVAPGAVVIRDGTILAVRRPDTDARDADVPSVDGGGAYLVPGLIDMHVHLRHQGVLALYLAQGVTTVRNMNGYFGHAQRWRSEVEAGTRPGPRIVNASPTIRLDQDAGYPATVHDADEARTLTAQLARDGWQWIKLYQVPRDALPALLDTAHDAGLPVAGHVPWYAPEDASLAESRNALLEAITGMQTVEHMGGFLHAWFRDGLDADQLEPLAAAVKETGLLAVTPILGQDFRLAEIVASGADAFTGSERQRIADYTGAEGLAALDATVSAMHGTEPWHPEFQRRMAVAFHRAGIPLLLGTDSHSPFAIAGRSLYEEAQLLQEGGIPAVEVLRAATRTAARVLGLQDRLGAVAAGYDADLVLLERNPLVDAGALDTVTGVVRDGQWLDRAALDAWLRKARETPPYCRRPVCES